MGWNKGIFKLMLIPSNVISDSVTVMLGAELLLECSLTTSSLGLEVDRNPDVKPLMLYVVNTPQDG